MNEAVKILNPQNEDENGKILNSKKNVQLL